MIAFGSLAKVPVCSWVGLPHGMLVWLFPRDGRGLGEAGLGLFPGGSPCLELVLGELEEAECRGLALCGARFE